MNLPRPSRLNLRLISFVVVGLALSVFTWGLQYKLSLYDPPQAVSHSIPEAKLLNKDGQSAVTKIVTLADTKLPAELTLCLCAFFLFLLTHLPSILLTRRFPRQNQSSRVLSCDTGLNAFFFRPPPVRL